MERRVTFYAKEQLKADAFYNLFSPEETEITISESKDVPISIQYRLTFPKELYPPLKSIVERVASFRITNRNEELAGESENMFCGHLASGFNAYFVPLTMDQNEIWSIADKIGSQFGAQGDEFIVTPFSVNYHKKRIDNYDLLPLLDMLRKLKIEEVHGLDIQLVDSKVFVDVSYPLKSTMNIKEEDGIQTEVAILHLDEKLSTIENYALKGVRFQYPAVEGPPGKGLETLFQVIPRHRFLPDEISFKGTLGHVGMHPKLKLSGLENVKPPFIQEGESLCRLFYYTPLSKHSLIDRYMIQDQSENVNLVAGFGEMNLEKPEWAVKNWGSEYLMEILNYKEGEALIPLHLRYGDVAKDTQYSEIDFELGDLFYACDSIDIQEQAVLERNVFQKRSLGYERYFDNKTLFYHAKGHWQNNSDVYEVPIGDSTYAKHIDIATLSLVGLGAIYLMSCL
ncbi:hypothetical protein LJB42_003171 [Komagataella kurtzmanii]|nr:hypothetical protein LJB42_003171 [Komagataella kurtzmanii]